MLMVVLGRLVVLIGIPLVLLLRWSIVIRGSSTIPHEWWFSPRWIFPLSSWWLGVVGCLPIQIPIPLILVR